MIETERLVLRAFAEEDAASFLEIMSDTEVNKYLPWYCLTNIEDAKKMLTERYIDVPGYHYAICLKNGELIGYLNVSASESHDFGYGMKKEYWSQGYATEASLAVIEVLKESGIPFITATHDILNPASGEVMKKIGMEYQYTYEELWQPKNILVNFRLYQLNFHSNIPTYSKYKELYPNNYVEDI